MRFLICRCVAQKPGFLRSLWVKTPDCRKNPVSDLSLRGPETMNLTFLTNCFDNLSSQNLIRREEETAMPCPYRFGKKCQIPGRETALPCPAEEETARAVSGRRGDGIAVSLQIW